jgi:hypothetical protein
MRHATLLRRLVVGPPQAHLLESAARTLPVEEVFYRAMEPLVLQRFAPFLGGLSEPGRGWFEAVRNRVHGNAAALLAAEHRVAPLLAGLVERGIPVCLLKGAAQEAMGESLPGRPRLDLDLLVPEGALQEAESWLLELGYQLDTGFLTREGYLEDHFHLPFRGPLGPVELHWSLTRSAPPGAVQRMWARTTPSLFAGSPVQVLAPGDRLLHHCLHISEHNFQGMLRWLGELSRDWGRASQEAFAGFRDEAPLWPERSVAAPLWLLSEWGDPNPGVGNPLKVPPYERALLSGVLSANATGVWPGGVPRVVAQRAIGRWLASPGSWIQAAVREGGHELVNRLGGPRGGRSPA